MCPHQTWGGFSALGSVWELFYDALSIWSSTYLLMGNLLEYAKKIEANKRIDIIIFFKLFPLCLVA